MKNKTTEVIAAVIRPNTELCIFFVLTFIVPLNAYAIHIVAAYSNNFNIKSEYLIKFETKISIKNSYLY